MFSQQDFIDANPDREPDVDDQVYGDIDSAIAEADHVIEGEVHVAGPKHMYMEPNVCLAIPKEDGEMDIFVSTQDAHGTQVTLSKKIEILQMYVVSLLHIAVQNLGLGCF